MAFFEIKGVLPPVITPFTETGEVDYGAYERNLAKFTSYGLCGALILGSNGETPYIDEEDKLKLLRLAGSILPKDMLFMAGTGLESTSATLKLTEKAAEAGARCALVLTPGFYGDQMGDRAQINYFTQVADRSPIPVLIYNVTKFTHVNISVAAVSELSHHPNIIGMKDSSGNLATFTGYQTSGLSNEFNLMLGTASTWYPAMSLGIRAGVMALANCCPGECVQVQKLYEEGKYDESLALYRRMYTVNACVTGKLGVPALKYACDLLGFEGGHPKSPLLELTESEKAQVRAVLSGAGVL